MSVKELAWFLVLALLLTAYALWGVGLVPFHPDESTQLYNSIDFSLLLTNPLQMAWDHNTDADQHMLYRLLDAPITRYLLGLGRTLAGVPAPQVDWEWSKTYEENLERGALPDQALLTGRISITLLVPITLLWIYLSGRKIGGHVNGLVGMVLMGINALMLLHGRRAMAEGALLCGVSFALWCFLEGDRRPWLAGLGMALAFNAKQSTLVLLPVGMVAVVWNLPNLKTIVTPGRGPQGLSVKTFLTWAMAWSKPLLRYFLIFAIVTAALNPFLWRRPVTAAAAALEQRQELLQKQVTDTFNVAPERVIYNPLLRFIIALVNLHFAPPSFAEWGNYSVETSKAERRYLLTPGHNLLRNTPGGIASLSLATFGFFLSLLHLRRADQAEFRTLSLALLATLALSISAILVPLTWQRYVVPLVPVTVLWQGYAAANFSRSLFHARKASSPV